MRNFNESSVIGGQEFVLGSKFDSYNLLIDKYYALLFYTLRDGITYSTDRNAILAKVRFEEKGFVNYVQPCIGKWDYDNPKYQRNVSPDFVLYLFNNICLAESLYRINELCEPIKISSSKQIIPDGINIEEFSVSNIIKTYEEYQEEFFKLQNGLPNNYDKIPKDVLSFVNLSYGLLEKVTNYSKEFVDHQLRIAKANGLRQDLENGIINYDDLDEEEQYLVDYECDYDEYSMQYYLSLGFFNNMIRDKAIEELSKQHEKLKNNNNNEELAPLGIYDDPIRIEFDDYDEKYDVSIDYEDAKEFENGTKMKIDRRKVNNKLS